MTFISSRLDYCNWLLSGGSLLSISSSLTTFYFSGFYTELCNFHELSLTFPFPLTLSACQEKTPTFRRGHLIVGVFSLLFYSLYPALYSALM